MDECVLDPSLSKPPKQSLWLPVGVFSLGILYSSTAVFFQLKITVH